MQHAATRCNTLQHTATHYNTLQHTTTHYCNTQHTEVKHSMPVTHAHCNTLQYTATHCNTLQHTSTHTGQVLNDLYARALACHVAGLVAKIQGQPRQIFKGAEPIYAGRSHFPRWLRCRDETDHHFWHGRIAFAGVVTNTLQLTATHCNTLQHTIISVICELHLHVSPRTHCSAQHHAAHTATFCNTHAQRPAANCMVKWVSCMSRLYMYICIHVNMCECINVNMCTCIHIHMYINIYTYVYIYTYIYLYL